MFYMQLLINKRGPLSKIWLAAHWDKKVTKAHIFECNLEATIEKMLSPKFKIALRTLGHLLLGVVRIYHRKTKYLLTDCSEALLKMQSTFQPGLVDLPKGNSEANYDAITLPEEFYDFDTQLPDTNAIEVAQHFTLHQSKTEDITLTEFYGLNVLHRGNFDEDIEIPRHASFFSDSFINSSNSLLADHSSSNLTGDKIALEYDGFGDEGAGRDMIDDVLGTDQNGLLAIFDMEEELPLPPKDPVDNRKDPTMDPNKAVSKHETRHHQLDETTLLCSEEEGFVLYPIVDPALLKKQKSKKKRKLLIDPVKQLSKATMQKQLTNYEDTLAALHIAPPTKKLMVLQELGSVDKLLTRPTQPFFSEDLQRLFAKCLKIRRKKWQQKTEERSKQQNAQELSVAESLNIQQDINYPQKESVLQSSRNERGDNTFFITMESVNDVSALSDDLLPSSVQQESENGQAVLENGSQTSNLDNEEQRRSKRTLKLLNTFRHFEQQGAKSFSFLSLCKDQNKKEVAENFYSLLVLQKQQTIELAQSAPYADIIVTAGPRFRTL
ncbi:double-strand-break repair protein rad21-like protein 1 isoform X1 [Pantherophis guttatus]|uniref:Double-strand-break repair protein rad21-like protein 1 isoform X1 n=1 Tax=Pantherophis guttatus TaxID=94885 RepID=A0A6P9B5C5_PANGU|nr:double-strand-break repair protein rad21-like protein 1 isoform X1 [Pantherophis guttatus]